MATIQQIRDVLDRFYSPRYCSQSMAFEQMLMDKCEDRKTEEFIRGQIDAMIAKGELPFGQVWTEAWDGFYSEAWMILPCQANEILLLDALAKRGRPLSAENLLNLKTNKALIPKLATTQKWKDQQSQAARDQAAWSQEAVTASNESIEAAELESELLSSWFKDGKLRWDADPREFAKAQARIKSLSLQELRNEVASRNERKHLRNLPKEELRTVVNSAVNRSQTPKAAEPIVSLDEIPVPVGMLKIPALYYPPGKLEGLSWSIRLYELLPASERQRLIRTFGSDQIVAACRAAKVQGAR